MAPRLSVIFTIRENFRKFPADTKFPENVQPYTHPPLSKSSTESGRMNRFGPGFVGEISP